MFQHNLLLTYRNFIRHKGSFFINIFGLSTGLACAFLIFLWVRDELSVNSFHANNSRLFQLMNNVKFTASRPVETYRWTPFPLAEAITNEMPEVESAVSVFPYEGGKKGIVRVGDKHIKAGEQFASKDFFTVFSYALLEGEKSAVLTDKNSVVISDKLAYKLFGKTQNVIGRNIEWDKDGFSGSYLVSGVFQTPSNKSTAQFDMVFSFALFREKNPSVDDWGEASCVNYIVLKEETQIDRFKQKIARFLQKKSSVEYEQTLFIRLFSDSYLYDKYENGQLAGGRIEYVRLFSIIALFIVFVACINFMNLSTAKASLRLKEVGVKKALGAGRKTLIVQFLSESVLLSFVSLVVAIILVAIFLPYYNKITGKHLSINPDSQLVLTILSITLLTGFVAGSYPALYLSSFQPALVLKSKLKTSGGELWIRRGLVVFQFTLSVVLIVFVIVVYKQIEFIQSKNLGYNRHHIVMFKKEGKLNESLDTFLGDVKKIPGVVNATNTWGNMTRGDNYTGGLDWEGKSPEESITFASLQGNFELIETLGIELKEGRAFSRNYSTDTTKIIFNEAAIDLMGLEDPVGKTIKLWGQNRQIIGVVKNFHFESLYDKVKPCFLILEPKADNILVKLNGDTQRQTIQQIKNLYQSYNNSLPFEYTFLEGAYQQLYEAEKRVSILSRYFASIAILIACLGLFSLASFTANRRRKEIGIRKVLGSSEMSIIQLLSREFMQMVFMAAIIALPISYIIAHNWLNEFAYQIKLEWWFFIGAGSVALLIAWMTVATQTLKAAKMNPIQTLREE